MANIDRSNTKRISWKDGMRVFGKHQMDPKDYGEYLMRTGKSAQNHRRRSRARKCFSK